MIDRETRRSLCLLLRLQGYQVANEEGTNDRVPGLDVEGKLPTVGKKFSDLSLRPDQLKQYLDAVQAAVKTDPGVVRLAYTIFRCLGFPHGNAKFAGDLYGHLYDGSKGDFTLTEIGPFVDRFSEPGTNRTLTEVIKTDGMIGLAVALNKLPAEKLGREWENMKLLLDLGDKVEDIRNGTGASGGMKYKDRQAIVMAMEQKIDEFAVAQAKRLLEPETMVRLKDPRRVKFQKGMLEARPKGFTDLIKDLAIEIPGVGDRRPTK
jgi:hypothetical protein